MKKTNRLYFEYIYLSLILFFIYSVIRYDDNVFEGLIKISTSTSYLTMDYVSYANLSATLLNSILVLGVNLIIIKIWKIKINGAVFAGLLTVYGFSVFGKNLVNMFPIYLGVYLYALSNKHSFSRYYVIALFASGLSPIVSFGFDTSISYIILGIVLGVIYGFITPTFAAHAIRFHNGYTLYNIGFAGGVFAIIAFGVINVLGFDYQLNNHIGYEHSSDMFYYLLIVSIFYLVLGLVKNQRMKSYKKLLSMSGRAVTDFGLIFDSSLVAKNVGLVGLIGCALIFFTKSHVNSVIFGGVITMIGFAAFGKHPRNVIPIFIGVLLIGILTGEKSIESVLVIALFGTALAPIAGDFGFIFGIIAGVLHYSLVVRTAAWHGGLNLYNNGFATGFIAAFLSSILDTFDLRLNLNWRKDKDES